MRKNHRNIVCIQLGRSRMLHNLSRCMSCSYTCAFIPHTNNKTTITLQARMYPHARRDPSELHTMAKVWGDAYNCNTNKTHCEPRIRKANAGNKKQAWTSVATRSKVFWRTHGLLSLIIAEAACGWYILKCLWIHVYGLSFWHGLFNVLNVSLEKRKNEV